MCLEQQFWRSNGYTRTHKGKIAISIEPPAQCQTLEDGGHFTTTCRFKAERDILFLIQKKNDGEQNVVKENNADSLTWGILSSTRRRLSLGEVPLNITKQEYLDEIRENTAFQRWKTDQLDDLRKIRDLPESTQTANPEEHRRIQTLSSKRLALLSLRRGKFSKKYA